MRQAGQYVVDSGGNAYSAQQQQQQQQRMPSKSNNNNNYQPAADHESDKSYGSGAAAAASKGDGQWRWERDGSASHMVNEGLPSEASRSYYQTSDQQDVETFEALQQRFYDDICKLTKQQNDAEDVENARHRQRVNAINAQYEEQLAALRARHGNRRDEVLRRESQARQQQYQAAAMEQQYTSNAMGFNDPPHVDSYRDRPRFTGGNRDSRDPGFDPRGQYPGGRGYGSGSRYY